MGLFAAIADFNPKLAAFKASLELIDPLLRAQNANIGGEIVFVNGAYYEVFSTGLFSTPGNVLYGLKPASGANVPRVLKDM